MPGLVCMNHEPNAFGLHGLNGHSAALAIPDGIADATVRQSDFQDIKPGQLVVHLVAKITVFTMKFPKLLFDLKDARINPLASCQRLLNMITEVHRATVALQ